MAPVGASLLPALSARAEDATKLAGGPAAPVPTRQLGRQGPQVSMLIIGGDYPAYSPQYLDLAWAQGIRYFDTAAMYGGGNDEPKLGQWLTKYPERRKELFLVSKDHPHKGPEQLLEMVDQRLARCKTSYLDLYFIHGINPRDYGEESLQWPKSDAFKKVCEQLKSSGKVKMVGFSCHDDHSPEYLAAAAEGGFVDALMVKYTPFYEKGDAFDRGLDACHAKGIGLIAMKTLRNAVDVPKHVPEFEKLGLTTQQAVLHACWSDPRISAVCNRMENVDQMQASVAAVRNYQKPLSAAHREVLREIVLSGRRTMCPGCPSCYQRGKEIEFAFSDISRYVTYYEQDGNLAARNLYHALPAARRNVAGVDLAALREGCAFKTDYPEIMRRAERYFV